MSPVMKFGAIAALGFLAGRLSVAGRMRRLRAMLAVVRHVASHDALTGLPNRSMAAAAFTVYRRRGEIVLALVDLDRFKAVNDRYGHQAGDDLLRVVADRLVTAAASVDGFVARLSGDEFVLLLADAGVTSSDTAIDFAGALHQADVALYHAKGGNERCRVYTPAMRMPATTQRHGPRRRDRRYGEVAS